MRTLGLAGTAALIGAAVQGIGNYGVPVLLNLVFAVMALVAGLRSGLRQGAGES